MGAFRKHWFFVFAPLFVAGVIILLAFLYRGSLNSVFLPRASQKYDVSIDVLDKNLTKFKFGNNSGRIIRVEDVSQAIAAGSSVSVKDEDNEYGIVSSVNINTSGVEVTLFVSNKYYDYLVKNQSSLGSVNSVEKAINRIIFLSLQNSSPDTSVRQNRALITEYENRPEEYLFIKLK